MKSTCTPSQLGVSRESPTIFPVWERVPTLLPGWRTNTGWQGKSTCTPSRLGVSRWSHQLFFLPGVECLHCFPARGLPLPAWERVPAFLPGLGPNTVCQGKSTCTPSRLGVSRWSHQLHFLSGKECLHSFLAGGLTLAGRERVPALLPGWGTNTVCQGKHTCTPSRLGLAGGVTNYISCLAKSAHTP